MEDLFLSWVLPALLLAAAVYAAFRAGRTEPPATRMGFGLHAAMLAAMALMLVPGLHWPALPQVLFFSLAAWWFVLRAVSRRPLPFAGPTAWPTAGAPAGGPRGRRADADTPGSLLYHASAMSAMAYMLAAMDVRGAHGTPAGAPAGGPPGLVAHHGGADAGLSLPGSLTDTLAWINRPALFLAFAFGVAGAVWCGLLIRRLRPRTTGGLLRCHGRGEALLELVGAASMALMFAALAA